MKRLNEKIIIILTMYIMLILFSSCGKQDESNTPISSVEATSIPESIENSIESSTEERRLADELLNYFQNTIAEEYGMYSVGTRNLLLNYNSPDVVDLEYDKITGWDDRCGVVSGAVLDFDADGQEEMVVIHADNELLYEDSELCETIFYADLYEDENGKIVLKSSFEIGSYSDCDNTSSCIGIMKFEDRPYLYYENCSEGVYLDYLSPTYRLIGYDEENLFCKMELRQSAGGTSGISYSFFEQENSNADAKPTTIWQDGHAESDGSEKGLYDNLDVYDAFEKALDKYGFEKSTSKRMYIPSYESFIELLCSIDVNVQNPYDEKQTNINMTVKDYSCLNDLIAVPENVVITLEYEGAYEETSQLEIDNIASQTEAKEESVQDESINVQIESESNITKVSNIIFEHSDFYGEFECALITGYTEDGLKVWEYQTAKNDWAQCDAVEEIGINSGKYYFTDIEGLKALDVNTGSLLWHCSESPIGNVSYDFDDAGNLYIIGYLGHRLTKITPDGQIASSTDMGEYFWAADVKYAGDYIDILFELGPDGYDENLYKIRLDLNTMTCSVIS